jgi:hypothetical protein
MTGLTNAFHAALVKVHDIAKNGTRNTAAWQEVLETVDAALAEARSAEQRRSQGQGLDKPKEAEITRLNRALQKIADYSPASTVQPVLIARAALKGEAW